MYHDYIERFNKVNRIQQFKYICLTIALIYLFRRYENNYRGTLLGISVAAILVYMHMYHQDKVNNEAHKRYDYMLTTVPLNSMRFLHGDTRLIELLYSLREYHDVTPENFSIMLTYIDQFMKLVRDIRVISGMSIRDVDATYESAVTLRSKIMNALQSIVTAADHSRTKHLLSAEEKLQTILAEHLDKIYYTMVSHNTEINTSRSFHYRNTPRGMLAGEMDDGLKSYYRD